VGQLTLGIALLLCLLTLAACSGAQPAATETATTAPDTAANDSAEEVLQAYRTYGGEVVPLDAASSSVTVDVVDLAGTIAAYDLTGGNPPCYGFIRTAPSLVFTLAEDQAGIHLSFRGNQVTNLIIVEEGEDVTCPPVAAATATPEFTLENATAGRYGIWIGRIDMDKPVEGQLTVSLVE
jgi:hypothetical protein